MDKAKLIERGRKLARLADVALNPNFHEAESAKEALDRFLIKNNLTYRDLGLFTLFKKELSFDKRMMLWEQQLLTQVCLTFGSQSLFYESGTIHIVGEQSSVEGSHRMFDYLHKRITEYCEQFLNRRSQYGYNFNKNASRNSYCIGITFSVCIMLNKVKVNAPKHESQDQSSGPSNAEQMWNMMGDVEHTRKAMKEEFGEINDAPINLEDFSVQDMDAYNAGMYDGMSIQLNLIE